MQTINYSYRALRQAIGVLGIALPILLVLGNQLTIERSISYYYYTKMSTVFTGVLITFGLILITYRGTESSSSSLSENRLTNIAGLLALVVAVVPTTYANNRLPDVFYVHSDIIRGWIHNGSAGLFFILMGLIVLLKFTKTPYFKTFYIITGVLIMIGVSVAIISFFIENEMGVFLGETMALWAFGAAWLRRGVSP